MDSKTEQSQEQLDADQALIQHAKDLYTADKDHWNPIYDKARDDLKFLSDESGAQWNPQEYADRIKTGRPALQIDYLSQFVHQTANDIRMSEPSINVIPVGNEASIETADVFKGLIKKIEYTSSAPEAYDSAVTNAIKCSIGYIRVDHDYIDPTGGFDQELQIKRVINPFVIFPDHNSIESDGCDQGHCTVLEKIKVREFKRLYPEAAIISFDGDTSTKEPGDDDELTIAEFFIKSSEESEITAPDGKTTRTVKSNTIMRYKLAGQNVLSRTVFPGEYIPVVPVYGEEAWIDGKRELFSLIRKAKQAQMMFNLWKSLETELIMKQPQAPVMVPAGSIDNYKDDWLNPNKSMALRYDQTNADGSIAYNKPERLSPPTIPTGIVNAASETVDDIKATMGLYNNSIGKEDNEVSGVAIKARKLEGDVATYHYGDNHVRSLTQVGRIIVSAAPIIYDTQRLLDIINAEDEPELAGINGALADKQEETHDFSKGKYDVRVTTGASYTTKRQEAAEFFQNIVKQQPQLMQIMGDLLFKNMDFAGAEQMAERMKKTIPPQLLSGEDGEAPAPDPQIAQLTQQLQQAQQQIEQMAQQGMQLEEQLKNKQASEAASAQIDQSKVALDAQKLQIEAAKLDIEREKVQIDAQKAQTDEFKARSDAELRMAELEMQARPAPVAEPAPAAQPQHAAAPISIVMTRDGIGQQYDAMDAQEQSRKDEERAQEMLEKQALMDGLNGITAAVNNLTQAVTAPKEVVRGEDGRVVGVK